MKKIENEANRQMTFSKRRTGLFKKASELCALTGVEVALVVFSPSNKAYSFGHPSVESIVDRYLGSPYNSVGSSSRQQFFENSNLIVKLNSLNAEWTRLKDVLEQEQEQKKSKEHDEMEKARQIFHWWERPLEELTPEKQNMLKSKMEKLKCWLAQEIELRKAAHLEESLRKMRINEHLMMNPYNAYQF